MLICCDMMEDEEEEDGDDDEEEEDDPHLRQTVRLWLEWGSSLRAEAKIGGERGLTAVLYVSTFPGITFAVIVMIVIKMSCMVMMMTIGKESEDFPLLYTSKDRGGRYYQKKLSTADISEFFKL